MNIKVEAGPYGEQLGTFFTRAFPGTETNHPEALFEAITAEVIGTKQTRYGPKPKPEALVKIRDVIRTSMEAELPIPFLVPWGCRKQGNYPIDIAELCALKTLKCLATRVQRLYKPGVRFRVRLEDLTDEWLFAKQPKAWIEEYRRDFMRLVSMIMGDLMEVVPESQMMDPTKHWQEACVARTELLDYLQHAPGQAPEHIRQRLFATGWKGDIPAVQREYYYKVYRRFYPNENPIEKLAEYFASTLARTKLCAGGADGAFEKNVQLSFSLPVDGNPMTNPRIYIRTIPKRFTSDHAPAWNSKGYLLVRTDETVVPKLAGWNDQLSFEPGCITVTEGECSIQLQSDYVVEG